MSPYDQKRNLVLDLFLTALATTFILGRLEGIRHPQIAVASAPHVAATAATQTVMVSHHP
jgi:hypothetical protein